jgi:fumarate reductase subunit D
VEIFVDKIPAVDTANDIIQTVVRPAAGAILFAASTRVITDIHPVVAIVCGLIVAGGVHAVKATSRPVITTMGGGVLNPVVSVTEDVVSAGTSVMAILVPVITFVLFLLLILGFYWWVRRRRQRRVNGMGSPGNA